MDTSSFFQYPTRNLSEPESVAFLEEASERDWQVLLSYVQTRNLRRGEVVFRAGALERALYLIGAGSVEVGGRTVGAPATFNEIPFLDGAPTLEDVRAREDSELLRLSFEAFESLAAREPNLGRHILLDLGRTLARRLRT